MPAYQLCVERLDAPAVIVHGGAGAYLKTTTPEARVSRGAALVQACERGLAAFTRARGDGARAAALAAIEVLEADARFNAGRGSKLQRDGRARLSAALMDGRCTRLSAVYNVEHCLHPSRLTDALQAHADRNLDGDGARALMCALGMRLTDVRTPRALARWRELVAAGDRLDAEGAIGDAGDAGLDLARAGDIALPRDLDALRQPGDAADRSGTVGALALGPDGALWACTSTGGRGHEAIGRVSDTPTPAGNYACPEVALSATGFGEQILDLNLCGRLATRVIDGASLEQALRRTFDEVVAFGGLLGVIALTARGEAGYAYTTEACGVAWRDASGRQRLDPHSQTPG